MKEWYLHVYSLIGNNQASSNKNIIYYNVCFKTVFLQSILGKYMCQS